MNGLPIGSLGDAAQQYLAAPGFDSMRAVENALDSLPPEAASLIRCLLEMLVDARRKASAGEESAAEYKAFLEKALERNISAIAQAGNGNTAQTGDGTQTVQPPTVR